MACHYSKIGEVNGNLTGMLGAVGVHTPFDVEADSAPALYVHGQPARAAAPVRALEQAAAQLKELNLVSGKQVRLTNYLADPVELKLLHMVTADPKRTPSLVLFANDNFWLSSGPASCGKSCVTEPAGTDAWNHGDVASRINTTWLGMVGPGVAHLGVDDSTWSDHTNIQPTMMELLGLHDDYTPDGRVLVELFEPGRPAASAAGRPRRAAPAGAGVHPARGGRGQLRAGHAAGLHPRAGQQVPRRRDLQHDRKPAPAAGRGPGQRSRADPGRAGRGRVRRPAGARRQAQALIHRGEQVLVQAAHLAA